MRALKILIQNLVEVWILITVIPFVTLASSVMYVIKFLYECCFKKANPRRIIRSVLITGASSGIGEGVAHSYAEAHKRDDFVLQIYISGRDEPRLKQVQGDCAKYKNVQVTYKVIDVTDRDAMKAWIEQVDASLPDGLDVVIANAGVSEFQLQEKNASISFEDASRTVFDININGVLNTVFPAIECFKQRNANSDSFGYQHIVVTGSVSHYLASYIAGYSASKSFVHDFGRFLRLRVSQYRINVNVILPGWVASRMSDSFKSQAKGSTPFMMSADAAGKIIVQGIANNDEIIYFPWLVYVAMRYLITWLPYELSETIASVLAKSRSFDLVPDSTATNSKKTN